MDVNLQTRRERIREKIAEIQRSIQAVKTLGSTPEDSMTVDFELGNTMYSRATIENPARAKVHLWLGASIMLEYTQEEALQLLDKKLADNQSLLDKILHDLKYAREQITTMELNIARLHNTLVSQNSKAPLPK